MPLNTAATQNIESAYSNSKKLIVNEIDIDLRVEMDKCFQTPKDSLQIQLNDNYNIRSKNMNFAFLAKNPVGTGKNSVRNVVCKNWKPPN